MRGYKSEDRERDAGDSVSFENVRALRATELALKCNIDGEEEVWIPQSQITSDSEVWREGDEGKLVVTRWIAEQKNLV